MQGAAHTHDRDHVAAVALRRGDHAAFTLLYQRHSPAVHQYLLVALRDPDVAEDVAQEAFMKAFRCGAQYEARGDRFEAWLFRIVRNCAIDQIKRDRGLTTEDPFDLDRRRERSSTPGDSATTPWDALRPVIARLPKRQQQVLALRYLYCLPTADIARVLDRSPDAVRQLEARACRILRMRAPGVASRE